VLHRIRHDDPGQRFENVHERHRISHPVLRVLAILLGLMLMVAAAATFWLPGPNFVLVLAGLALVSAQWRLVARGLDRLEVTGRNLHERFWKPLGTKTRRLIALVLWLAFACACLAALMGLWHLGVLPDSFTRRLPDSLPYAP
jgi:hypothetical protein